MNVKEELSRQRKELLDLAPTFEAMNIRLFNNMATDYVAESLCRARNNLLDYMGQMACQYILTSIGVRVSRNRIKQLQKEFEEANYHFEIEAVAGLDYSVINPQRKLINRPEIDELYTLEHYQEFAKQVMNVKG